MPFLVEGISIERKRKRKVSQDPKAQKKRSETLPSGNFAGDIDVSILEAQIKESPRYLNNVVKLMEIASAECNGTSRELTATVALCRVFCRLHVDGRLLISKGESEKEDTVRHWLDGKYSNLKTLLLDLFSSDVLPRQKAGLIMCMQLVKEEITRPRTSTEMAWSSGLFKDVVEGLIDTAIEDPIVAVFATDFANRYDDVRHQTFLMLSEVIQRKPMSNVHQSNALLILSRLAFPPDTSKRLSELFCDIAIQGKARGISSLEHRKQAQLTWLAMLNSGLDKERRKLVLRIMTALVVPWFRDLPMLMDFLTDSYNAGGATSLLALEGLFHLMQEKNLDYPDFYVKLYSLLDDAVLHSKHRSRFFRLLNTFMSSTHLPAAMVASFIKRLSRLALSGPPAGIVAVIPWVYNMLKSHPTCTFMLHRVPRIPLELEAWEESGFRDRFIMSEVDPMNTRAIESSLWELETLQSHYHPNVASLAKIMSEQFTKTSYNLEDFLDHSYTSLIETELSKDLRKTPVVEFQIPKTIFKTVDGDTTLENYMHAVLESK